jgi:hypothetical protein
MSVITKWHMGARCGRAWILTRDKIAKLIEMTIANHQRDWALARRHRSEAGILTIIWTDVLGMDRNAPHWR